MAQADIAESNSPAPRTRIVVLGGGFGGTYTARHLERLFRKRPDVEVVLVSRDNFFVMTPLLFEVCAGVLDLRHCSVPLRAFLRRSRFVEAFVNHIDVEQRVVHALAPDGGTYRLPYDQLVLALGAVTNRRMIPGSENAFTLKWLADAFLLRNYLIERFERADVETDPLLKRKQLTFVIIGGGLVGVELLGELTAFVDEIVRYYVHVRRDEVRFFLFEGAERILPEVDPRLAEYAAKVLRGRAGVEIRTGTRVLSVEREAVHLANEAIPAATIVLTAGILPNPLVAALPVERDRRGYIMVDAIMRSRSHPEIWALGDCAHVPDPNGKPYPALAQHALREARVLAGNIQAVLEGGRTQPFVYSTLGIMGSLGHCTGFGQLLGFRAHGFFAWWVRRTYYLLQMPGWARRLRLVIDWTFALLFRASIVKIDLVDDGNMKHFEAAMHIDPATPAQPDRQVAGEAGTNLPLGRP